MDEDNLKKIIGGLTNKLEQLESQLKDLQSQQLETGNNIVTLIQHAETMNNVTDASGMLAQHVTELEEQLNSVMSWMEKEIRQKKLN
jgi:archaellum component FlaC